MASEKERHDAAWTNPGAWREGATAPEPETQPPAAPAAPATITLASLDERRKLRRGRWDEAEDGLRSAQNTERAAQRSLVLAKTAGAVVYPDRIEYEGQAHPLTTNTRASLDAQGGTMVAQGMAVKTTHDTREIYVLVEDPGYYLQIRAHKAQGAGATDAGAMVFNGVYNSNMKAARALVGAINNAARAVGAGGSEERFEAVARAEQSRRQADAGVKQLAEQLADEVARDRQALASLANASTSAGKRLARILADEEAWYRRGGTETGAQTVAGCLALLLLPTAIVLAVMGLVVPAIVAAVMFLALGDYLTWWRLLAHKLSRT